MNIILYNQQPNTSAVNNQLQVVVNNEPATERKPFIEANTVATTLSDIQHNHIIPVFLKDNEPVISHSEFIETTYDVVGDVFRAERILSPSIRLSHPIKGRVPDARNKPASELQEWERTIYYERCAFIIEIPTISDAIGGEPLCLSVGGVKAYNLDNLYNRKGADEHFKLFIGFRVSVCTNLCVWTDGYAGDVRVKSLEQLKDAIYDLLSHYDAVSDLVRMSRLQELSLTESQFAQVIGRCRLYQHLPSNLKREIPELQFGDSQINSVCRDYYRDSSFCRGDNGDINLWRLYNLFTASNKQSYIDTFLDRAANASSFTGELAYALEHKRHNWFLG